MRLIQNIAEFDKFIAHRPQKLPDLAGPFLDGERTEPHLQSIEMCRNRGRSRDSDPKISLQLFMQPGPAQHLGVKPFDGKIHKGEIRSLRRISPLSIFTSKGFTP